MRTSPSGWTRIAATPSAGGDWRVIVGTDVGVLVGIAVGEAVGLAVGSEVGV